MVTLSNWWKNVWVQRIVNTVIFITFFLCLCCLYSKGWDRKKFASIFEDSPTPIVVVTEEVEKNNVMIKGNEIITNAEDDEKIIDYIKHLQPRIDDSIAEIIATSVIKYSGQFGFPPELICSLIYKESSFNVVAISSANCLGLMQINPKAHADKIKKLGWKYNDLCKIDNNILLGCMILNEYYISTTSIRKALKRYVGGNEVKYVLDILAEFTDSQISPIK